MDHNNSAPTCRINNWNNAGVWVFFGFIVAPVPAFLVCMALFTDVKGFSLRNDQGELGALEIGGIVFLSVLAVALFVGVFTVPVFWIELADRLTFRKLLGVRVREWTDVKSMAFEVDESKISLTRSVPGGRFKLGTHRFLVIELADDEELRVRVTNKHVEQVQNVAAAHGHPLKDPLAA